eukprot:scaffold1105_cov61-Cylindrotheca_fusiformis.AAC.1
MTELNAFRDCKSLERLSRLHEGLEELDHSCCFSKDAHGWEEWIFHQLVQVIHDGAFQLCRSLERLGLEEGVIFIGEAAFKGCEC